MEFYAVWDVDTEQDYCHYVRAFFSTFAMAKSYRRKFTVKKGDCDIYIRRHTMNAAMKDCYAISMRGGKNPRYGYKP